VHPYHGEFLRMNLIEQDITGELICVAYQDQGFFFLSFINNKGEELANVELLDILELD
jgi:hypothetical protein